MKQLSIMLKPASSLCNLRCKYCFYADVAETREVCSYGIMTAETTEKILENIHAGLAGGDFISFAFQGGEPTLAGLPYFEHFAGVVDSWEPTIKRQYAFQTNGILLDKAWCDFFRKYDFLLGVSWDVLTDCHDAARVDAAGNGTAKAVLNSIRLLEREKVEYNILCTLTGYVARHPEQVWSQLVKQNIRYTQFTPCLGALDASSESPYALTPKRFASFYDRLFPLWYADFCRGNYRSIKYFDDLINLMAFGRPTSCGINGQCQPQLVVEADGSVYPCDFYCLDEYCLGNLAEQPLDEILSSPKRRAFVERPRKHPNLCKSCEFAAFCGGGCQRMQKEICCSQEDTFCGCQTFLRGHFRELMAIAEGERRYRMQSR